MANPQTNIPIVFAKDLRLNDRRQPDLTYKLERSGAYLDVAELPKSREFAIYGNFKATLLRQHTSYKAAFLIKIEGDHFTTESMKVKLTMITMLDGSTRGQNQVDLDLDLNRLDRDNWIKIESAPFERSTDEGDIEFRMTKMDRHIWTENIFVNAIVVKPSD